MDAEIHSVESLAALDGEGLRYAVFFRGCPLRCAFCHNPDTWAVGGDGVKTGAEDLCRKISRYKPYFGEKGGVTFSGGEPLLSAEFICKAGELLREMGIGYALDTSGAVPLTDAVKEAIAGADLVILDVKFPDAARYRQYTGGDFDRFLRFAAYLSDTGTRVWYRTVIVPEINDSEAAIDGYISLISRWRKPEKYELLAFHTMGFYKYDRLGLENPLKNTPPLDGDRLKTLQGYLDGKMK